MRAQIGKWGNSLAIRIPGHVARQIAVCEGGPVEISVEAGRMIIEPVASDTAHELDALIAKITDENRHEEFQTGKAVGSEFG